jgi:cytochrome P450
MINSPSGSPAAGTASSDFFSEAFSTNPFPLFAQLRSIGAVVPVPFSPFGQGTNQRAWLVTRWEEAVQILKDHQRFTVDPSSIGTDTFFRRRVENPSDQPLFFGRTMISVDEPDHRRLRGLVSKAFTPKHIQGLRPRIQQLADELLDAVQDQGTMDLVSDFAYPLSINAISEMLGVPPDDRPQIRIWSDAITGSFVGGMAQDEERRNKVRAFSAYVMQLVARKRQHPQDDLTSQLIQMEEEGDLLRESWLLSMIALLIFAGHETTSNLIGIGILILLDHPDQLDKLKADLSLVPRAVEELLRFSGSAVTPFPRFAAEDLELGGQHIQQGDSLIVALASANWDETQFTQPDELDVVRRLSSHIAFGRGIHVCLGAPLARLEGDIAFTTLLRRMPDLRLNVPRDTITWRTGSNLRGVTSLHVAF